MFSQLTFLDDDMQIIKQEVHSTDGARFIINQLPTDMELRKAVPKGTEYIQVKDRKGTELYWLDKRADDTWELKLWSD